MKKALLSLLVFSFALNLTSCEETEEITKTAYAVEEENSTVKWKGYSPSLYHDGSFKVTSPGVEVVDGKVKSGTFTIPIASIQNFDLEDHVKPALLEHLKSPDFFNMVLHPNASFKITNVQSLASSNGGGIANANYTVTGDFTLLGQTHAITFPARIMMEGSKIEMKADFQLDRTKWGMMYAADPALGEHHILPKVDISLDIKGHKQ
ncbi:YceI family protein [Rufibacter hautae]|uniref:YceI family protein n=1 Tax=Rufibacter hautae TaxID=2595005 RepID=A0A5B6TB96_9BACT|nr:YceI family protein [Rufibacter hautae]KAA3437747.1 YceI family protein [Rufibacter hautae]